MTILSFKTLSKQSAILVGFVILSGTFALATIPTLANAEQHNAGTIIEVCDNLINPRICKEVVIVEEIPDGVIVVGETIQYIVTISVTNPSLVTWFDVSYKDRFGGDLAVGDGIPAGFPTTQVNAFDSITNSVCLLTQKGATAKEFLDCTVDDGAGDNDLSPAESASVGVTAVTDFNKGQGKKVSGTREYTSCSRHDVNSGAGLSFTLLDGTALEFQTPPVTVEVFEFADLSGDCDRDGFTDLQEINLGTDAHDAADFPACGGSSIVDSCVDGNGIADRFPGTFSIIKGQVLTTWPTSIVFGPEGIDWFDNDASLSWTLGDDIHLEDPTGACSLTAIRNAFHDLGLDCKVLDLDGLLANGTPVSCDLETGAFCGVVRLADLGTVGIKFFDGEVSVDGSYNNGEDIIKDSNGNGVFD